MTAGDTAAASIIMQNSGTNTWSETDLYRLGSQNPQDNMTLWGGRALLPAGVTVAPGKQFTFAITITAPSTPGTYNFQCRMVWERISGCRGGAWFGAFTTNVPITVTPPVGSAPTCNPPMSCPTPGTTATVSWTTPANDISYSLSSDGSTVCGPFGGNSCSFPTTAGIHTIKISGKDGAGTWWPRDCGTLTCVPPAHINVDPSIPPYPPDIFTPFPQQGTPNPGDLTLQVSNIEPTGLSKLRWQVAITAVNPPTPFLKNPPVPTNGPSDLSVGDPPQKVTLSLVPGATLLTPGDHDATLTFKDGNNPLTAHLDYFVRLHIDPPPCGAPANTINWMCGKVIDAAGNDLPGVVLELRNSNGAVVETQTTGQTAGNVNYIFKTPVRGNPYFVSPVAGRNQVAAPQNISAVAPKEILPFTFRGSMSKITATGAPQSLVLITPDAPYDLAKANPPAVGQGSQAAAYSAVIGAATTVDFNVPSGSVYFITCWKANTRTLNAPINGGVQLLPKTVPPFVYTIRCPAPKPQN